MAHKTVYHDKIGECELIIEAEIFHESGTKYFALVSSFNKPKYEDKYDARKVTGFGHKQIWGKKLKTHYYVLWGNKVLGREIDFDRLGITHLLTDALNPIQKSTTIKRFFEMIHSSKFMTFKQK